MKRFLFFVGISVVSQVSVAQWKFNVALSVNGCSRFDKVTENWANAQLKQWNATLIGGFPTKGECENARSIVISSSVTDGKCKVQFIASPCVGSGGAVGNVDVLGVSKGGSFNSTNPVNEINDWSNDDMERMLALNNRFQPEEPAFVQTGDVQFNNVIALDTSKPFRSLNVGEDGQINTHSADLSMRDGFNNVEMANDFSLLANKENVQRYVEASKELYVPYLANPQDLTSLLHKEFLMVSGFDVDAIWQKLPSERTDAEKQALIDYQEYRKSVTDNMIKDIDNYVAKLPETKDFEMAVLAEDCYKDSEHAFLLRTNYKEVHSDFFEEGSPMRGLSELIDEFNATNPNTGFHAERYYNEKTNEYTIAFEGTNSDEIWNDIIKADAKLGLGGIPEQYKLAYKIAEYINNSNFPDNVKINFTGHSLGGGLASLVGLVTNKPTYTYNAAGVNKNITDAWGLTEKVERKKYSNIKAFQSEKDQLTSVQEGNLKPIATGAVTGVVTAINPIKGIKLSTDVFTGKAAAPAVGNKEKVWNNSGHSITPMVSCLAYSNSKYESIKKEIYEKGHSVEYQTQESIKIFTGY